MGVKQHELYFHVFSIVRLFFFFFHGDQFVVVGNFSYEIDVIKINFWSRHMVDMKAKVKKKSNIKIIVVI